MVDYYLGICKYLQIPIHTPLKLTLHITPETQKKQTELLKNTIYKHLIQSLDSIREQNLVASKCCYPHYFAQLANYYKGIMM